jgi:hypothetical protein
MDNDWVTDAAAIIIRKLGCFGWNGQPKVGLNGCEGSVRVRGKHERVKDESPVG